MKDEMSAFDILAITSEMQGLVGGYLDKVFHWDGKNVLLRINTQAAGKKELLLLGMKWLYISAEKPEMPDIPSQFAVNLRKYLTNTRVVSVRQREFDRIVVIDLEKGPNSFQVIIELFGDGNLLLVSENNILNSIHSRKWRHREIRPGVPYEFPSSRFDPTNMDLESFRKTVLTSSSDVVRTLATTINIGGQYAEDLCLRTNVEKDRKAKTLSDEEIGRLFELLTHMLKETRTAAKPREIIQNGGSMDVTPIPLVQYATLDVKEHPTMSEAIDSYIASVKPEPTAKEDPEVQRLERQLAQQRLAIDEMVKEAQVFSDRAALLYTDYIGIESLLSKIREASKDRDWEWIKGFVSKLEKVKAVEPKDHEVTIEIDGQTVPLDYTLGLEGNANALYSRSKEFKDKLEGAKQAVAEAESRLGKAKKGAEKEIAGKKEVRKTKEFWFERYKWFVTSGGRLVLAGRDTHSNDQLVKKHLRPTDRFAHADVHGAPSVVVLKGEEASDEEMQEACQFALSHSKAWMAAANEGTAYWVLPDQVSKMAQAGEFVPRGAFVIRGKRNYVYHLPLELAVGEIEYEGTRKIMCGPSSSIVAKSNKYVVILPGDKKNTRESGKLAKMFEVPEEEISRILPPGTIKIAEVHGIEVGD